MTFNNDNDVKLLKVLSESNSGNNYFEPIISDEDIMTEAKTSEKKLDSIVDKAFLAFDGIPDIYPLNRY